MSRDRNTATLGLLTRICPPLPDNRAPKDVSLFKSSLRCIRFLLLSRKLSFGGVAEAARAEGQLCPLTPTPARPGRALACPAEGQGGSGRTRLAAEGRAHFRFGSAGAVPVAPVSSLPDATETAVLAFLGISDITCTPHPLLTRRQFNGSAPI